MQFTINLEEIEVEYATMYHDECENSARTTEEIIVLNILNQIKKQSTENCVVNPS